jgi:hypothetical protein
MTYCGSNTEKANIFQCYYSIGIATPFDYHVGVACKLVQEGVNVLYLFRRTSDGKMAVFWVLAKLLGKIVVTLYPPRPLGFDQ